MGRVGPWTIICHKIQWCQIYSQIFQLCKQINPLFSLKPTRDAFPSFGAETALSNHTAGSWGRQPQPCLRAAVRLEPPAPAAPRGGRSKPEPSRVGPAAAGAQHSACAGLLRSQGGAAAAAGGWTGISKAALDPRSPALVSSRTMGGGGRGLVQTQGIGAGPRACDSVSLGLAGDVHVQEVPSRCWSCGSWDTHLSNDSFEGPLPVVPLSTG